METVNKSLEQDTLNGSQLAKKYIPYMSLP